MRDEASEFEKKSTNVRHGVPESVRGALAALSRVAPPLATRVAMDLFSRPHRGTRPARERRWLESARRFHLEVEGLRLPAWSWGDGPMILLHHGWSSRGSQLGGFVGPLVDAGCSVVAYDAPAHGDAPGRRTHGIQLSRVMAAILDRLAPVEGILAHSFGCTIAALAMRRAFAPRRAVFISPPASMLWYADLFCDALGFTPRVRDRMIRSWERRLRIDWTMFEAERLAPGQRTSLLVIHDRDDRQAPWEHGQRFVDAWPDARLTTTHGLGHTRILYDPAVAARAAAFLVGVREPARV
jgi:pimeloyl-ACP methyl ester carboxylesterase